MPSVNTTVSPSTDRQIFSSDCFLGLRCCWFSGLFFDGKGLMLLLVADDATIRSCCL